MERERLHPLGAVAKRRVARQAADLEIARRHVDLAGLDVPVRVAVARGLHRARIALLRLAQRERGAVLLRDVDLCSDNLDQLPACGEHRLADYFEVFGRSIG